MARRGTVVLWNMSIFHSSRFSYQSLYRWYAQPQGLWVSMAPPAFGANLSHSGRWHFSGWVPFHSQLAVAPGFAPLWLFRFAYFPTVGCLCFLVGFKEFFLFRLSCMWSMILLSCWPFLFTMKLLFYGSFGQMLAIGIKSNLGLVLFSLTALYFLC